MKTIACMTLAGLGFATTALGTTYYADKTNGNDAYDGLAASYDGTHGPMRTIQKAVDAASANDTISIAAGVYGAEQGGVNRVAGTSTCRVYIDKSLTIVAPDGRDKTVLEGAFAETESKCGTGSVAGFVIGADAASTKISGLTIRNCSSDAGTSGLGTAVIYLGDFGSMSQMPWIVDCRIQGCCSYDAALVRVNVVRSFILDCCTRNNASVGYQANFLHCIIARNSHGESSAALKNNPVIWSGEYVVNCTFARNGSALTLSGANAPKYVYNCLVTECDFNTAIRASDSIKNCVLQAADGSTTAPNRDANLYGCRYQIAAPAFDDYRPLSCAVEGAAGSGRAAAAGSTEWLNALPTAAADYAWKDVYGNEIDTTSMTVAAGAVQVAMTARAGFTSEDLVVNGISPYMSLSKKKLRMDIFIDEWPALYTLDSTLDAPETLFRFRAYDMKNQLSVSLYPDEDETALYVPKNGVFTSLSYQIASQIVYVAEDGKDEDGAGTVGNPYATIQYAVDSIPDAANTFAIVRVGPGVYATGGKVSTKFPTADKIVNRVAVNHEKTGIAIRSIEGAATTTIRGDRSHGLGNDAVRCVRFANENCSLRGFTLTDGCTNGSGNDWDKRGGAVSGVSAQNIVADCVVSNCLGSGVSAGYYCSFVRCYVATNVSSGAVLAYGRAINSVFAGNVGNDPALGSETHGQNCTFHDNTKMSVASAHGYLANCIISKSWATSATTSKKLLAGCIFYNFDYNASDGVNIYRINYTNANPVFASVDAKDFRLVSTSPAFGNQMNAWKNTDSKWTDDLQYEYYYANISRDMEGNVPYFVNGKPAIGAYYKPGVQKIALAAVEDSTIAFLQGGELSDAATEVIVKAEPGLRPLSGLEVNGILRSGVDTWSFRPCESDFVPVYTIKTVTQHPMRWFVNASAAGDSGKGWDEGSAKKTLAAVMQVVASGDSVCALPGVYASGSMLQTTRANKDIEPVVRARVVVPSGITLYSRDGAETTAIRGEKGDSAYGKGDAAMRCAYVNANATLKGFTLTGGATRDVDDYDNGRGGAVLAGQRSSSIYPNGPSTVRVEDCIISNNVATIGGGASDGSFVRCRFFGNVATTRGAAVSEGFDLIECVFDQNMGREAVMEPYYSVGCTFGANNVTLDGASAPAVNCDPGVAVWTVKNSLFLGGSTCRVRYAYHCALPTGWNLTTTGATSVRDNLVWGDVSVVDYRPTLANVAIDAANPEYRPSDLPDVDLSNAQRIYNNALDIGALEADWRPRYAKDVARRLTVSTATSAVVESADGTVVLPAGASLIALWDGIGEGRDVNYTLNFRVSDGGSAHVTVNGVTTEYSAGVYSHSFESDLAVNDISFSADSGSLEILRSKRNLGMVLVVR